MPFKKRPNFAEPIVKGTLLEIGNHKKSVLLTFEEVLNFDFSKIVKMATYFKVVKYSPKSVLSKI